MIRWTRIESMIVVVVVGAAVLIVIVMIRYVIVRNVMHDVERGN